MRRTSTSRGGQVTTIACDVTDRGQVERTVGRIVHDRGGIDVLVNNAGIIQVGPLEHMTVADFEEAMATHFWGPLFTILAALPHMRAGGAQRIVNISSIGGKIAVPHLLPYSASKFALTGLSEGLRSELASQGFAVTDRVPGPDAHRFDLQRPIQGPAPAGVRLVPPRERHSRALGRGGAGRSPHRRCLPARRSGSDPDAWGAAGRARERHLSERDRPGPDVRQLVPAGPERDRRRSARTRAGRACPNTFRRR